MRRFHRILQLSVAVTALLTPFAAAQQPAAPQAPPAVQSPPPVYTPTSLVPEPGLPRTADGRPDFQGEVWAVNFFPVFEANAMAKTLTVSEAEAKAMVDTMVKGFLSRPDENTQIDPEVHEIIGGTLGLPIVRGERRTRHVVLPADGKLPIKPEVKKEIAPFDPLGGGLTDPEARPPGDRCLTGNGMPPMSMTLAFNRLRFVQTKTHVLINTEMNNEIRIVPFGDKPQPIVGKAWMGNGFARWEGDTLVVETTGLPEDMRIRGFPKIVVNPDATVVERFTRVSKNELLYQWTVVDPKVYTAPWLAEFSFFSVKTGMFESPCHEHNQSMGNILKARMMADERAALAAKPGE